MNFLRKLVYCLKKYRVKNNIDGENEQNTDNFDNVVSLAEYSKKNKKPPKVKDIFNLISDIVSLNSRDNNDYTLVFEDVVFELAHRKEQKYLETVEKIVRLSDEVDDNPVYMVKEPLMEWLFMYLNVTQMNDGKRVMLQLFIYKKLKNEYNAYPVYTKGDKDTIPPTIMYLMPCNDGSSLYLNIFPLVRREGSNTVS